MAKKEHVGTALRQKQIIAAARKLIIEGGTEQITMKNIAGEVGITDAGIYRHFKGKKDILSLLVDDIENSLLGDISKAVTKGNTPLETLDKILRGHISAIERRRGITFRVIAEIVSIGDRDLNKKVSSTISKYIDRLQKLLAEGVKSGEVRDDIDLEAAATALFGMIQGLATIWALSNYSFNPEKKYIPLWNIFHEGVINRSA
jgi:AcrR family transcriptional regulator